VNRLREILRPYLRRTREHVEAHEHLQAAARYWLPNPRDEMEIRELVERWIDEARRFAEGVR
jgi:hypothetical protein